MAKFIQSKHQEMQRFYNMVDETTFEEVPSGPVQHKIEITWFDNELKGERRTLWNTGLALIKLALAETDGEKTAVNMWLAGLKPAARTLINLIIEEEE